MTKTITPLAQLVQCLGDALKHANMDAVRTAAAAMGPHRDTLSRALYPDANGKAVVGAGLETATECCAILKIEDAAEVACALGITTETVATCVEGVVRHCDAAGDMETSKRIFEWLIDNPQLGLTHCHPGPPATYRAVCTWRLEEVYPMVAQKWKETARELMQDARMREER